MENRLASWTCDWNCVPSIDDLQVRKSTSSKYCPLRNSIWDALYVDFKNMMQMNLFTNQKQTHRLRDFGTDTYTLLYLQQITNKDLLYSTGNSAQCYVAVWMGGKFGGEWIHAQVWLSPFAIHLKLSQHCKLAILQCKIKV